MSLCCLCSSERFPSSRSIKLQFTEANCAVLEFMAMKVLRHVPCWTEVNDPKTGNRVFVSVRRQHRHTWDKIRFAVTKYIFEKTLISARVYGKTHDSAKVTMVVSISKQYAKLKALCAPIAVLPMSNLLDLQLQLPPLHQSFEDM